MKVIFLGTGTSQGIPVIACDCIVCHSDDPLDKRLRSSVYIQTGQNSFVIDSGSDFRQQVLRENINQLDGILYTHAHKDHTGGVDELRSLNFHLKKHIPIYGQANTLSQIQRDYSYIFSEKKDLGAPQLSIQVIENNPFEINKDTIIPIEAMHHNLPIFGYRIGNFTYITDANKIEPKELEKIQGTEIMVINALRKKKHLSHFNLKEALEIIEKVKPHQAYLTHIGHLMGIHQEVQKELPKNVNLAYDRLTVTL